MKRLWLLALLILALGNTLPAMAQVRSLELSLPREYGFFIGDTLESDVDIEVAKGTHLLKASLPTVGRVTYWLELRDLEVVTREQGDSTSYRLILRYQTFYAPLDTRRLKVPGFDLQFENDGKTTTAKVPDWSFVTSSLREIEPGGRSADELLAPDILAQPLPLAGDVIRLAILGVLLLASLAALAFHRAWWPFHRRPARPFARAARVIARQPRPDDAATMSLLHRAFDAAFHARLLADDLPAFLDQRPEMRPMADDIAAFFARSRAFFFGTGAPVPAADTERLARRLAGAERGRA